MTPKAASPRHLKWHVGADGLITKTASDPDTSLRKLQVVLKRKHDKDVCPMIICNARRALDQTQWQTTRYQGGLWVSGFIAPLTIDGPITGPMFRGRVEQHLTPVLQPGELLVMELMVSKPGLTPADQKHPCRNLLFRGCQNRF